MTPAQKWMGKVARVPCVLCARMGLGDSPSVVHHLKYGTGASDRASDFLTIAVCPHHHAPRWKWQAEGTPNAAAHAPSEDAT